MLIISRRVILAKHGALVCDLRISSKILMANRKNWQDNIKIEHKAC
jgi:hypothetical protein